LDIKINKYRCYQIQIHIQIHIQIQMASSRQFTNVHSMQSIMDSLFCEAVDLWLEIKSTDDPIFERYLMKEFQHVFSDYVKCKERMMHDKQNQQTHISSIIDKKTKGYESFKSCKCKNPSPKLGTSKSKSKSKSKKDSYSYTDGDWNANKLKNNKDHILYIPIW